MKTLLIANRGEIALRVIHTARALGIRTVAIHNDLDQRAPHVRAADHAVRVSGYLDIEAVVEAALASRAEAIHPGYGFLSERAAFARAVEGAGLSLVGPSSEVMDAMGRKDAAREIAIAAGVPVVPSFSIDDDPNTMSFPVLVKAAAGGGGKGMRIVRSAGEYADAVAAAKREAAKSFGDDTMLVEKYVEQGRHIEVQVMADTHGNVVHLFERDCSTQRRHQKVLEEAPAPTIDAATRTRITEASVNLARQVGYVNAGTVEFLLDTAPTESGEPAVYFLEMNTRLQVEHPVTELITGVDLVELQLRVAAGEELPFTQADVTINGHAIECRINAEDPAEGAFLPSPGTLTELDVAAGIGVRWDGGYETGDEVSQFYDNLTGKLCVWGRDRERAIARMIRALEETTITGVATTIPADLAILRHPDFAAIEHSTKWVEEVLDLTGIGGAAGAPPDGDEAEEKVERNVLVEVGGKRFDVKMWIPESEISAGGGGGAAARPRPRRSGGGGGAIAAAGTGAVAVPMQGTIVKVLVEVGQEVEAADTVCVLEAMKMENNIAAGVDGTVAEVKIEAGASVSNGDVVIVITPAE